MLVRIRCSRFHHANPVIGELGVQIRRLHFGHVAGHAFGCSYGTRLAGQLQGFLLTALTVDYDLHVFGPDGLLAAEDETDEAVDHVVELQALVDGQFVVYVNSGRGEVSDQAYALAVLPL